MPTRLRRHAYRTPAARRALKIGATTAAVSLLAVGVVDVASAGITKHPTGPGSDLACGRPTTATSGANPEATTDCTNGTVWQSDGTGGPQELVHGDSGAARALHHPLVSIPATGRDSQESGPSVASGSPFPNCDPASTHPCAAAVGRAAALLFDRALTRPMSSQ